ncbi:trypsin-like serine protease [Saccharopolyspora hirsuta]|uniref:Trypsin-like serine protease n=1 Tax=Saccharopolyspora hirsuta TaxID=1837 RepID=A0A5M7BT75_SACHI|nr:trypsin-like serine protease [Saccharopolyspora hirsuta]KAA5829575.1 trypsin-like serine protease [Saccharopolyspora hirsuta]
MSLARNLAGVAGAVLAAAAFTAPAQAAETQASDVQPYIIDGREVDSAPWAARLFTNGQETCTATIIAPEWILTAQHCVEGAGDGALSFNIGNVDQTQGEKATAKPGGVVIHDTADLALVNIDHAVQTEYSPLGSVGDVQVGQTVQTYGWGATCTDRPEIQCQSQILKVADVNVTDIACSDYRGGTAVCASRGDGIPAGGDSGGPMFAGNVQVGVASTSDRQSTTAYTNITEYRDWIQSVAGV